MPILTNEHTTVVITFGRADAANMPKLLSDQKIYISELVDGFTEPWIIKTSNGEYGYTQYIPNLNFRGLTNAAVNDYVFDVINWRDSNYNSLDITIITDLQVA